MYWINGHYECRLYNNIMIFRDDLMLELGEDERVETDDMYIGEDYKYVKYQK